MSIKSRLIWLAFTVGAVLLISNANDEPAGGGNSQSGGVASQQPRDVAPQPSSVLVGRVVRIADGDTLTLLDSANMQTKIRLAEIDTPERNQPYGAKAKQALAALVFQKDISVRVVDMDKYGRTVGRIYVGATDVSAELITLGAAWVYRDYLRDESLLTLEAEARVAKRGIWGLSETQQVPPWEWRRLQREGVTEVPESPKSPKQACSIKGNISKSGKIYHVPGSSSYNDTRINEAKGERWFCSEEEARAAGWRAPRG